MSDSLFILLFYPLTIIGMAIVVGLAIRDEIMQSRQSKSQTRKREQKHASG